MKKAKPTTRYTNWESLLSLSKGEIFMEDLCLLPLSTTSGKLDGIFFYLDGTFDDKDAVMSTISNMGGEIKGRMSKNISKWSTFALAHSLLIIS